MRQFTDSYHLAPDADAIVTTLLETCDDFGPLELDRARIVCILSERAPMLKGWPVRAWITEPRVQGVFKWWFDWALAQFTDPEEGQDPDFVIMIDAAVWGGLGALERQHLLFHELCHISVPEEAETGLPKKHQDGRPFWRLRPHTFEAFPEEMTRFAGVMPNFTELAQAVAEGYRQSKPHEVKTGT